MCQALTQSIEKEMQIYLKYLTCVYLWNGMMKLPLLSQFLPIMWKIHISQSDSVQSTKDEEDERTGWGEGTHARESQV